MVRKKPEDIFLAIYDALKVKRAQSINQIADAADVTWDTAKTYLGMILMIQEQPNVIIVHTKSRPLYRREKMAGRPRKE